ncbi:MAG: energy transducer TonB [Candidatus Paracaedibacteraceae bacterium]|nr:energy transducer TonB [Candidatus Paracaedibacteraceae bacterium]
MKTNKKNTLISLMRSLIISSILHIGFGASSFAIWHALQQNSYSRHTLPQKNILTTSVEFIPIKTIEPKIQSSINQETSVKKAKSPQKKLIHAQIKPSILSTDSNHGSSLPDILPHPENRHPDYPEEARNEGVEAICVMKIRIMKNGTVQSVESINKEGCPPLFVKAAQKALFSWKFSTHQSAFIDKTVPITFKLN